MHVGKNNPQKTYKMNNIALTKTSLEKDLGVLMNPKLNFKEHIDASIKKS